MAYQIQLMTRRMRRMRAAPPRLPAIAPMTGPATDGGFRYGNDTTV